MNDLDVAHSTGRGVRNRLTQQRRRAAVQLASAGWTACQIADLFGVAPWIVRRCLSDQGALAPEITDELLSPRDVEIAVGLTRRWISELVKTGKFPPPDQPSTANGMPNRWRRSTIDAYLNRVAPLRQNAVAPSPATRDDPHRGGVIP